jgi:hypothetical protein
LRKYKALRTEKRLFNKEKSDTEHEFKKLYGELKFLEKDR